MASGFSDDIPGLGIQRVMLVPAPEVDLLGYCTWCGEPEDLHVGPGGETSVRAFHRSALGGSARYIDEVDGEA
jgi:hypothetical protein